MFFDENKKNWDSFLSTFMTIIDEIGSYDKDIEDEGKKTKLFRTTLILQSDYHGFQYNPSVVQPRR